MADETVLPSTLDLGLTQQTVTLPGATHTESVATLALVATLTTPAIICQFPVITRTPNLNFRDEQSDNAVLIGDTASGYPVVNKLITFDPREFEFEMPAVPDADKLTVMAFYEANKDIAFPWYNAQDSTLYEVVFVSKPKCRLAGRGDLWNMFFHFRQSSA